MPLPCATYRIQFHLNFRFRDAEELVPYLHALGITHLYASPRFRARKGSLLNHITGRRNGDTSGCAAESSRRARLRPGQKIISAPLLPLLLPCE
jgi:hypothetical protein